MRTALLVCAVVLSLVVGTALALRLVGLGPMYREASKILTGHDPGPQEVEPKFQR